MQREENNILLTEVVDLNKRFPFLSEYEDVLLEGSEILWEWNFGIVLSGPKEKVYKIGRDKKNSDKLEKEYLKHYDFYMFLDELKEQEEFKELFQRFFIPEIPHENVIPVKGKVSWERLFLYEMEKINGFSLNYHHVCALFRDDVPSAMQDKIFSNESDLEEYLINNDCNPWHVLRQDSLRSANYDGLFPKGFFAWYDAEEINQFYRTVKLFELYCPQLKDNFIQLLIEMYYNGYRHIDLHGKNVMISYDKNKEPIVYLIDFWISETPFTSN